MLQADSKGLRAGILGDVVRAVSQGDADSRKNPQGVQTEWPRSPGVECWRTTVSRGKASQDRECQLFGRTDRRNDDADVTFQISSIPTYVVIDPDGKVAAYQIGAAGEGALRESLAKAGLKAGPPK